MCLYIVTQDVKRSHLKFKNDKVICYKVLKKTPTFLKSVVIEAKYKAGWKIAIGKLDIDIKYEAQQLFGGAIHVFRSYKQAKQKARWYTATKGIRIVPVVCYKKDFIAIGKHDAAFKKVFIRKADFKKAMNV